MKKEEFECDICNYYFTIEKIGILASLDESCHTHLKMICYCKKCMIQHYNELLTKMKIHSSKHDDYEYIQKLMDVSFLYHEYRDEVCLILQSLKREYKHKNSMM